MRWLVVALPLLLVACGDDSASTEASTSSGTGGDAGVAGAMSQGGAGAATSTGGGGSASGGSAAGGAGEGGASCVLVDAGSDVEIATVPAEGEYALTLPATTTSHTHWGQLGNEAIVLDVSSTAGPIGQLVLHAGADGFDYTMALGHLDAGSVVRVKVSAMSSSAEVPGACVGPATLSEAADLGTLGEGLARAPIFRWPVEKRFDDVVMMLGWSNAKKEYQAYYTNENGGTVANCGGGSTGMQAEIARWGRGADIERVYAYGGANETWGRCTGNTTFASITPRKEGAHPIFYYGDGHNRLFESRGGYGQTCGTSDDAQADGDLEGWNLNNPGNAATLDDGYVITLRPLPVELDPLGYDDAGGRREGALDQYAPWIYRLTFEELARENKIDGSEVQPMENYVYVDVHANDVGGSGDSYCTFTGVSGGFKLRLVTIGGDALSGPQMTADYFGGQDNVKRIAFPLGAAYQPSDIASLVFDAYDDDGMYFLDLGDVFIAQPSGDNGTSIASLHQGTSTVDEYIDDDSSGCSGGVNSSGPSPPYPCVGGQTSVPLP